MDTRIRQRKRANPLRLKKLLKPQQFEVVVGNSGEGAADESKLPVSERHAYLEVTAENKSNRDIYNVSVTFGKNPCTFGIVGMGFSKGYLGWQRSVGTNVLVQWTDSSNVKKQARVDISSVYNPAVPGDLTFMIADTNATVTFKKIDRK